MSQSSEVQEFSRKVQGKQRPEHDVRGSWGVKDYYRFYRKNRPKEKKYVLTDSQYFSIIRSVGKKLTKALLDYKLIILPENMGTVEIQKYQRNVRIVDGKGVCDGPVDWEKTLNLWYEDPEAYRKRTLIKADFPEFFRVRYSTKGCNFKNRRYYQFRPIKETVERLVANMKSGFTDAPYMIYDEGNDITNLYDG